MNPPSFPRFLPFVALLMTGLLLCGCDDRRAASMDDPAAPAAPDTASSSASAADDAPPPPATINDFTMENLASEFPGVIRSATYAQQVQLIVFFLPDDSACAASVADWNALQTDYAPRGFALLGLIPDSRPAPQLRPMVTALSPAPLFPTGRADASILVAFGSPTAIRVVPTAYLLDRAGEVARLYAGHTRLEWIREDIEALLQNQPLPTHLPHGVLPEENAP